MARMSAEEKATRAAARKAARQAEKHAAWEKAMGPELATYYRGSCAASVMADCAAGNVTRVTLHADGTRTITRPSEAAARAAKVTKLALHYVGIRDQDGWETLTLTVQNEQPALAPEILAELRAA